MLIKRSSAARWPHVLGGQALGLGLDRLEQLVPGLDERVGALLLEALEDGRVKRIVVCRPAVEAGESLGYLPGDLHAKLAPYLRPITDALGERLGGKRMKALKWYSVSV